jgi:methylenetetrahydrofolate reductase (NADPH)
VHNDFHVAHGIFPLFDGLEVPDMERELHSTGMTNGNSNGHTNGHTNGHSKTNGETVNIGEKTKIDSAVNGVKSVTSALTNGLKLGN